MHVIRKTRNYQVIIRPSWMASNDPFFHGKDGVGGVTDHKKMILYLEDKHENPKDIVQRVLRKNAHVISHESGHMILMLLGRGHRVALRNDDFSGNKAGTMLNYWTAEVHDRDTENKDMSLEFWFWDWKTFRAYKYKVTVLDFTDLL